MKSLTLKTVLGVFLALALLAVGVTTFGVYQAGADGGTCRVKIADICLGEFKAGVEEIQDFFGPVEDEDSLGSGSSHATDPSMVVGGVERFYDRQIMRQATTTICSFRSPAATSTVLSGLVSFVTGSSSALEVTVAKATTAFATTTTLISDVTLAADIQGTIHVDPAVAATLDATQIIAPLNFVNVGINGSLADGGTEGDADYMAGAAPVGSCSIEFLVI